MYKQINELRSQINMYQVVPRRNNPNLNYKVLPQHISILLFGPSGSGKSSLIRTFYRSVNNKSELPPE